MTKIEAYRAAIAADDAYSAELRRLFGKRAGDVRYTKAGEGEPGSDLNRLYLAWTEANRAHYLSTGLSVGAHAVRGGMLV